VVTFDPPATAFAPLVEALVAAAAGRAQAMTVMHSLVDDTQAGIDVVRARWKGALGAYPESGYFEMPNWRFVDVIAPAALAERAKTWVAAGVQIIGGCCGTGVAHIRALKETLPQRVRA
jgi:homocysteine S-methyltransferase